MAQLTIIASAFSTIFAALGHGALAETRSAAHQFCAMQWASDQARMTDCVGRQIDGARSIVRYLDWAKASPGPDGRHVVDTFEFCSNRWSPDFHRVDACLRARALIAPPE
ncbi:MAG: hypothetical protein AAFN79_08230 [Pseudomonadota bacterium]